MAVVCLDRGTGRAPYPQSEKSKKSKKAKKPHIGLRRYSTAEGLPAQQWRQHCADRRNVMHIRTHVMYIYMRMRIGLRVCRT